MLFMVELKSQPKEHGEIAVTSGGSGEFIFNTFAQYKEAETGKIFQQKTTLRIKKKDSQPYWKLNVYALNSDFEGETGTIDIGSLELIIDVISDAANVIDDFETSIIPTTTPLPLATGHWVGASTVSYITVTIQYKITGDFITLPNEKYFNQLRFDLLTHTSAF